MSDPDKRASGPIATTVERRTFNTTVPGSNPGGLTNPTRAFAETFSAVTVIKRMFFERASGH